MSAGWSVSSGWGSRWPAWLSGGVLLALVGLLYSRIVRDLWWQWGDDANYSHGFLVPVFSAFLVWRRRASFSALRLEGSWLGLPVLLAGVGMLLLGDIGGELFLARTSLIPIIGGLVLLLLGRDVVGVLAFPLLYLILMIPLPGILFYAITFPLQGLAASNAAWTLDTLGIPVLLDGNVIHLSDITLGVTEACSGIRSLISLVALAVAGAYLVVLPLWAKMVLVVATIPITVAANAARIVATGLIGQAFGVEYATGFFHGFSGWVIFLVATMGMAAVSSVLGLIGGAQRRRSEVPPRPAESGADVAADAPGSADG